MSYQEITGTLNANQHGSYTTQDAFGDLLVTDVLYRQRTNKSKYIGQSGCVELYARSTSRDFEGGGTNPRLKCTLMIIWERRVA